MDFIKSIKQTNNKPIKIPYKNINILGYKFEIEVKDDPISQNLAYLILSVGLLEKMQKASVSVKLNKKQGGVLLNDIWLNTNIQTNI